MQSLERGLAVIRALSDPGPGLTLSDVGRATGLTRAAARRFLLTLEELGYVRSVDRRFTLTPRVLELGWCHPGQRVGITAGLPSGRPGTTSLLQIQKL